MTRANRALTAIAIVAAVACSQGAPTASTGRNAAVLKVGREQPLVGSFVYATLLTVDADSRCPINATCIWAGNAAVVIGVRMGMGPTTPYTVNTGLEPHDLLVGGYRVTLDSLAPYPTGTRQITQGEYVAYVTATFTPDAR